MLPDFRHLGADVVLISLRPRRDVRVAVQPMADFSHLRRSRTNGIDMPYDFAQRAYLVIRKGVEFIGENLVDATDVLDEYILVADGSRDDMVRRDVSNHTRLNLHLFEKSLVLDFIACTKFHVVEHLKPLEKGCALRTQVLAESLSDIVGAPQSPL